MIMAANVIYHDKGASFGADRAGGAINGAKTIFNGSVEWARWEQRAGPAPPLQESELLARDREWLLFR
jgi:hypothetical protein